MADYSYPNNIKQDLTHYVLMQCAPVMSNAQNLIIKNVPEVVIQANPSVVG